jgi:3-oxoacyl-[acyl-carrier protein] reductase
MSTATTTASFSLTGFDGKVALVTGAGRMRSIGRDIALALARAGCDIVLTGSGRSPDQYPPDERAAGWRDVDSVADEVREVGREAFTQKCDIVDAGDVVALKAAVLERFGRIDVVVNNAGSAQGEDRVALLDLKLPEWRRVIDTNLTGTFLVSQAFAAAMVESGNGGSIVNISSITAKLAPPNLGALATSKAGLRALTACLAQELATHQVRVNEICPGLIHTSRLDAMASRPEWEGFVKGFVPLGRAGTGSDIANAVVYLCSDQGAWITGQSWNVDGGSVTRSPS